jgi:hypothetical protein
MEILVCNSRTFARNIHMNQALVAHRSALKCNQPQSKALNYYHQRQKLLHTLTMSTF